jgi:hypothetical protein
MMLSKGRRKYITEICKNFVTVAFAAGFASTFFAQVTTPFKALLISCIIGIALLGFWAATE